MYSDSINGNLSRPYFYFPSETNAFDMYTIPFVPSLRFGGPYIQLTSCLSNKTIFHATLTTTCAALPTTASIALHSARCAHRPSRIRRYEAPQLFDVVHTFLRDSATTPHNFAIAVRFSRKIQPIPSPPRPDVRNSPSGTSQAPIYRPLVSC